MVYQTVKTTGALLCVKKLEKGLGMKSSTSDAALFFKTVGENLYGVYSRYVYDSLNAGDDAYQEDSHPWIRHFSV